jgi:hypothetical protein
MLKQNKDVKPSTLAWTMPLLTLWLVLTIGTGCTTTKLNNVDRLIERHPKGFRDAVRASEEATEFVRDALKTLADVEAMVERGN